MIKALHVGGRGSLLNFKRGFTLLEVLIACALFATFTLTLAQLLKGGMETFRRGQAVAELRSSIGGALDLISAEVRSALNDSAVTTPALLTQGKNKSTSLAFTRSYLNMPSGGMGIIATGDGAATSEYVTYTINSSTNALVRNTTTDGNVLIGENILLGQRLGEVAAGTSLSYFAWSRNTSVDGTCPENVLEIRLTGLKYVGKEELRSSMGTMAAVRTKNSVPTTPLVPVLQAGAATPSNLRRPLVTTPNLTLLQP